MRNQARIILSFCSFESPDLGGLEGKCGTLHLRAEDILGGSTVYHIEVENA